MIVFFDKASTTAGSGTFSGSFGRTGRWVTFGAACGARRSGSSDGVSGVEASPTGEASGFSSGSAVPGAPRGGSGSVSASEPPIPPPCSASISVTVIHLSEPWTRAWSEADKSPSVRYSRTFSIE